MSKSVKEHKELKHRAGRHDVLRIRF